MIGSDIPQLICYLALLFFIITTYAAVILKLMNYFSANVIY